MAVKHISIGGLDVSRICLGAMSMAGFGKQIAQKREMR
jgi:aryl-alcohol dehydrogenase-like predicted oxidoreductase